MGKSLAPRYGIRRGVVNGVEYKLTSCGDGTFSLVLYRKDRPPEYHLELSLEQVEFIRSSFLISASGKRSKGSLSGRFEYLINS